MANEAPYRHDGAWPEASLGNVTTKIGSGATPKGGSESYLPARQTFAFVRSQNVFDRRFDGSALAFITDEQANGLRGVLLQPGDVLLNITGDGITFGRAALVDESVLPACVNQHVSIVRADPQKVDPGYLLAYLTHPAVKPYIASFNSGGSRRAVTKGNIESFRIPLPPIEIQRAIAATLGALDDKIESNQRQRGLLRKLGAARFTGATNSGAVERPLRSVTTSIARGVTPKYADNEFSAPLVLNQKCIRDGWVSLAPARRAQDRVVTPAKKASSGDILVNSTGVGTLGRVARWHEGSIFVDSHVSVVKPDIAQVGPTVLAYAMLGRVPDIEALGEGSTGQTELSPTRLGEFEVRLPTAAKMAVLEDDLLAIERRADHLATENGRLTSLRDALLPELLSGRIRVPLKEILNEVVKPPRR